jgi:hypothetical protein
MPSLSGDGLVFRDSRFAHAVTLDSVEVPITEVLVMIILGILEKPPNMRSTLPYDDMRRPGRTHICFADRL